MGSITHGFTSAKSDGSDATQIQPSHWNAAHTLSNIAQLDTANGWSHNNQYIDYSGSNTPAFWKVINSHTGADANANFHAQNSVGKQSIMGIRSAAGGAYGIQLANDAFWYASGGDMKVMVESGYSFNVGYSAVHFKVTSAGAVTFPGIGTTATAGNAFLDSGASNNLLRSTSSKRYKSDLKEVRLEEARKLLALRPIAYTSKAEADDKNKRHFGFLAEDAHKIEPRLVQYMKDKEGNEVPDGFQYERTTVLLTVLVRDLYARLDKVEGELAALRGKHAKIR